jgi:hypothetical protein
VHGCQIGTKCPILHDNWKLSCRAWPKSAHLPVGAAVGAPGLSVRLDAERGNGKRKIKSIAHCKKDRGRAGVGFLLPSVFLPGMGFGFRVWGLGLSSVFLPAIGLSLSRRMLCRCMELLAAAATSRGRFSRVSRR